MIITTHKENESINYINNVFKRVMMKTVREKKDRNAHNVYVTVQEG